VAVRQPSASRVGVRSESQRGHCTFSKSPARRGKSGPGLSGARSAEFILELKGYICGWRVHMLIGLG